MSFSLKKTFGGIYNNTAKQLSDLRSQVAKSYIVREKQSNQISGYVFSVQKESRVEASSEITDHFSESNEFLNDHIALRPKRITLTGFVGEKSFDNRPFVDQFLQVLSDRLIPLVGFSPQLANSAIRLRRKIEDRTQVVDSIRDKADSLYKAALMALNLNTSQERAYLYFQGLLESRILVDVTTPFNVFSDMAVESVIAVQQSGSTMISDFSVTFKEFRVAKSRFAKFDPLRYEGYNAHQIAPEINNGNLVKEVDGAQVIQELK